MKKKIKKMVQGGVKVVDRGIDRVDAVLPFAVPFRFMPVLSLLSHPEKLQRAIVGRMPGVVRAGRRGVVREVSFDGVEGMEKRFHDDADGRASFANEVLAQSLFGSAPWKLPVAIAGDRCIRMPRLPDGARLDRAAAQMTLEERRQAALDALDAALDIHAEGYAHRDFSARNLYLYEGRVLVSDFETMTPYPTGERPAFAASYDVTGMGLPSPHNTGNMGYSSASTASLQNVLGVPVDEALDLLRERLKDELLNACRTFHAERGRHELKQPRIYCAFQTPALVVARDEAQRDAALRLRRFGIGTAELKGKRVLDLGCNAGAMLFQASQHGVGRGLGLEFDEEKVAIARRIAAFSGLNELEFRAADIDRTEAKDVGGPFDVVFCLAIEAHVKSPDHLYRLLGTVTGELLCFEGNSSTDPAEVERRLRDAGFRDVAFLGVCDDDMRPENNCRPLLVARK